MGMARKIVRCGYYKCKRVLAFCAKNVFFLLPAKKRQVVINNFNGRGFGCNPKYVALQLLRTRPNYKLYWLVRKGEGSNLPPEIKAVRFGSIRSIFLLSTSAYIVNNVKNGLPYRKKRNQTYLQTWHGVCGEKKAENEVPESLSPSYLKETKKDSSLIDFIISDGPTETEFERLYMWLPPSTKILETGLPRNDVYFAEDANERKISLKKELGIPDGFKIVIYAPTFRDDGDTSSYQWDYEAAIEALKKQSGENWVLLIRFHPNASSTLISNCGENIINVSSYPDPQNLWLIGDPVISDYSSVINDFMIQNKPFLVYFPDFGKPARLRNPLFKGLVHIHQTEEDLLKTLSSCSLDEILASNQAYKESYPSCSKGDASKRVVEAVFTN